MASAPGKAYRNGLSLVEAVQRFGDEQGVESMFIDARWPKWGCLPQVRVSEHPIAGNPQTSAVPLPRLPQRLQRQNWHSHGWV